MCGWAIQNTVHCAYQRAPCLVGEHNHDTCRGQVWIICKVLTPAHISKPGNLVTKQHLSYIQCWCWILYYTLVVVQSILHKHRVLENTTESIKMQRSPENYDFSCWVPSHINFLNSTAFIKFWWSSSLHSSRRTSSLLPVNIRSSFLKT